MATQTKSVVGAVTTYTITDIGGATNTIAVTQNPGTGITWTLASTGNTRLDGQYMTTNLLQMVSTGLLP